MNDGVNVKAYRKHVLVCCTEGCCGARGGTLVYRAFKTELDRRGLSDVLVTQTLCTGACPKQGATVVVHPDGLWYAIATAEEAREIVEQHLVAGQTVQRLLFREIRVIDSAMP
jgi:NADH-quinone oxidoreductase subunit F